MKKNPYALLINDIHVSKDNISDFNLNWDEALSICKDKDIDLIIVGGDMWKATSSQTLPILLAVKQALNKASRQGIYVILAEGNHDKPDRDSMVGYSHLFEGMKDIDIVDDWYFLDVSDTVDMCVMSYFPESGSFTKRYNDMLLEVNQNKKNILYIHEGIRGGMSTVSDDELPASMFSTFDSVLVGHYHDRKRITGTNIEYIGASRQHNFGEDEEKGYTILFDDGSYEFVKNQVNIRYKVIDVTSINSINEEFLKKIQQLRESGKYKLKIRINCKSSEASSVDKQKLLDMGVSKVELVTEQTQIKLTDSQSIEKKFDKNGIKSEYRAFCADRNISNVEIGIKYLDKIQSSCGN